jgi:pimeloyl-ACP methyl ester carboxylesterase
MLPLVISALAIAGPMSTEASAMPRPGLYEFEPQRLVALTEFADHRVAFTEFWTGRAGRMTRNADGLVAHHEGGDSLTVRAVDDTSAQRIEWTDAGRPPRRGTRVAFRREDVEFSNGDIHLSGTLVVPKGRGPFPAIVRIHGAGPADRVNSIDEYYAYHGIAFLSYDKRGVGRSSGDWRTAGVEELAGDAAAGVEFLSKRPDIDARRIGIGAGSEGGWVAAAVTGRAVRPAFVFVLAGPALGFGDELLYEAETGLRAQGVDGADLDQALAFQRWKIEFMRSGAFRTDAGWKELGARADSVRGEPWFNALAPWPRGFWRWEKYAHMLGFDPAPYWERYRGPVLARYGEQDSSVPAARNAYALRRALERGGNRKSTVEIVPDADHEGLDASKRDADFVQFVPGYLDRPLQWVLERVGGKRE